MKQSDGTINVFFFFFFNHIDLLGKGDGVCSVWKRGVEVAVSGHGVFQDFWKRQKSCLTWPSFPHRWGQGKLFCTSSAQSLS